MKVYIAASFLRREEASELKALLDEMNNVEVQARWITHQQPGYDLTRTNQSLPESYSLGDVEDVMACDVFICITGDHLLPGFHTQGCWNRAWEEQKCICKLEQNGSHGGRHTELGMAIVLEKPILLLGPKEQVHHTHPLVLAYNNSCDLMNKIKDMVLMRNAPVSGGQ